MSQYRYPGAKPFTTEQKEVFFGREKELSAFMQRIELEQLVVLYSKSGLGKSSLLNAGVIPLVREEDKYHPLLIRFGAWTEGKAEGPLSLVEEVLSDAPVTEAYLDEITPGESSLWYYAKKHQAGGSKPLMLIFDQFEELFTYPEEQVHVFKEGFSELLRTHIPRRIRQMIDLLQRSKPGLLSPEEENLLHRPLDVKVVIAIRSDRLHLLDKLSDFLPVIFSNNYELKALRPADARAAITQPAALEGDFITPPFEYSEGALHSVLHFLEDKEGRVESIQLQILCQSFEEKVRKENLKHLDESRIGRLDEVIANYYHDKINTIEDPEERLAARRLIEDGLILEEEQQRLSLHEGQISRFFNVSPKLLMHLVDNHLLRAETSNRGGYTYELSHDTLVRPVIEAKRKRKAVEEKQAREKVLARERRRRNQAILLAAVGFTLFILAALGGLFAMKNARKATLAQKSAETARDSLAAALENIDSINFVQFLEKGKNAFEGSDFQAAATHFEAALTFGGDNEEAKNMLAKSRERLQQKGRFDELVQAGEAAFRGRDYLSAINRFREAQVLDINAESNRSLQVRIDELKVLLLPRLAGHVQDARVFLRIKDCEEVQREIRSAERIVSTVGRGSIRDTSLVNGITRIKRECNL